MYLYIMRLFQYYVDALREVDRHRDPKPPTNKHSSLSLPPVLRPPSLTLLTAGREASCFPPIALALSLNLLSPPITLWSQESPPHNICFHPGYWPSFFSSTPGLSARVPSRFSSPSRQHACDPATPTSGHGPDIFCCAHRGLLLCVSHVPNHKAICNRKIWEDG
jgi:hypothetical protein